MMTVDSSNVDSADKPGIRLWPLSTGGFVGSVVLSYVLAVLLVVWIVYNVGAWQIISGTRILDFLVAIALVQFHDMVMPAPFTLPDPGLYFESQLPIDWRVVIVAVVVFVVFSLIKAFQFSEIARLHGLPGSVGEHMRAYLYGDGIDRFMPFYVGSVGTAVVLAKLGGRFDRALFASGVGHAFMIFELFVFGLATLFFLGWADWISALVWPIVMLGVVILLTHHDVGGAQSSGETREVTSVGRFTFTAGVWAFRALAQKEPAFLFKLCLLSILAFWLLDVAIYLIVEAWNDTVRSFTVPFPLLVMGIVGGYIARLVPITPGGIGQWEFGFGATLAAAGSDLFGIDFSFNLVLTAILANVLRSMTGILMMCVVLAFYGVPTNLRTVYRIFRGAESPPGAA